MRKVADAIGEGRSVSIRFPLHAPSGFAAALRDLHERDSIYSFSSLNCDFENADSPIDFLFRHFLPNFDSGRLRDLATLSKQNAFQCQLVLLEEIRDSDWTKWQEFLLEYERICRDLSLFERTLFLITREGDRSALKLKDEVCLALFEWIDIPSETDMWIFAENLLHDRTLPFLERQLLLSLAIELAGWDFATCESLIALPLSVLLTPSATLHQIAASRGWIPGTDPANFSALGIGGKIGGREKCHSAFVAISKNDAELDRRIWKAQLKVLYPAIEEMRINLLPKVARHLRIPLVGAFGETLGLDDLEVGQIEHHIKGVTGVERQTRDQIRLLTEFRHALAHLEPIRDSEKIRKFCRLYQRDN